MLCLFVRFMCVLCVYVRACVCRCACVGLCMCVPACLCARVLVYVCGCGWVGVNLGVAIPRICIFWPILLSRKVTIMAKKSFDCPNVYAVRTIILLYYHNFNNIIIKIMITMVIMHFKSNNLLTKHQPEGV